MIGIAVGLLVLAAALGTLMISRIASGVVGDLGQLHAQSAFALRMIGLQVRQAGSIEPVRDAATGLYAFDAPAVDTAFVTGSDGGKDGTDVLSVSHQDGALIEAARLDCLAETARPGDRVESTFFVGNGELRCRTAAKNQPLVGSVADFQVRYRVRIGETSTRRMTATQVATAGLWAQVRAVEVCLDLQGSAGAMPSGGALDCKERNAPDGRQHLVVRHVFDLRTQDAP